MVVAVVLTTSVLIDCDGRWERERKRRRRMDLIIVIANREGACLQEDQTGGVG